MKPSDGRYPRYAWWLALAYTAATLVPCGVLAVTEPYRPTTVIASFLIPGGLSLLWCMLAPNPARMVLWGIPLLILCAFQLVISYLFGNSIIAVDMFTNLITTNASEAGELLSGIYPAVIIVCVIYLPVIVWAVIAAGRNRRAEQNAKREGMKVDPDRYTLTKKERNRGMLTGLSLIVAGMIFALASFSANRNFALNKHIFPFNVAHNMGLSVERWWKGKRYPANVRDFTFSAEKRTSAEGREIYVLVIGEASRAANWSLYGYDRQTTPRLDTLSGLVVMRDVFTQSNTTHKSVPIILSAAAAENYNEIYHKKGITALFSEAGFRTVFITNQPPNRSLTDHLTAEADTVIYATPRKAGTVRQYDGEVWPHLARLLDSTVDNLFIVIHTYGSHAKHYKRYPREYALFTPDESSKVSSDNRPALLNSYDNSIYYTDHLLSQVIDLLKGTGDASAMLYISDHGEDLMDDERNRFLHASPTTTYYQLHVPALMWFSDNYKQYFPAVPQNALANGGKPSSTGEVFHTLAGMAFIDSESYTNPTRSWVSTEFQPSKRMYVTDEDIAVDVMRSGLDMRDIRIMEEKGLSYDMEAYGTEKF